MDDESLTEILSGRHFNMAERAQRGIWPHAPLSFEAVVSHLSRIIRTRTWFPRRFVPAESGEAIADVTVIERRGDHDYVVHVQRSGPSGYTVAGRAARPFGRAEGAAAFFLEAEFNLPGDIDGWKVVRDAT
jgi:hypothetical protein